MLMVKFPVLIRSSRRKVIFTLNYFLYVRLTHLSYSIDINLIFYKGLFLKEYSYLTNVKVLLVCLSKGEVLYRFISFK